MESLSLKILIPLEENDKPILHSSNHKGQKCEICSKVFFHEVDFKTHIKVHNGEKPFQCSFPGCFRKFNRKSNLEYHEKIFHKNNKLKKEDLNKKCKEFLERVKSKKKEEEKESFKKIAQSVDDYNLCIESINPLRCTITQKGDNNDYYLCGVLAKGLPK